MLLEVLTRLDYDEHIDLLLFVGDLKDLVKIQVGGMIYF